jgi:hypothetical protein
MKTAEVSLCEYLGRAMRFDPQAVHGWLAAGGTGYAGSEGR